MAEGYKSYRIRTKVGQDAPNVVNVHLDQTYDEFQILSLKIDQKNSYNLYQSDKGIIVGRVLANGGFGVPNAKVSVFIPSDETMGLKKRVLYPYSSVNDTNSDRVRYNLLPDYVDETCHQNVGTFPNKRMVLDNDDIIEIFDEFWKYTTVTNQAGDYMLYGIPTGSQTLHMDVDLSDIGLLSQRPRDLVYKGFNINLFESPNKFKQDTNLNSLAQIKSQDIGVFVYPFWGDSTDNPDNIAVTRCDIQVDYKFEPTCIFIGSIITDTGSNAIGKNCAGTDDVGKMSDLVSGEGSIEMIRKTLDNKVEEFQIKGNRVIDGDGVWCYQIPMNLDYVMTDEFGNLVPTDNPDKGMPTRTRVRFRISLDDPPSDNAARKRCKYLVPNNPRIDENRFPIFTKSKDKEPDYEFGTNTREESYCDLFWNKVYTVKNYIPRIQKNNKVTNRQHTGIKLINHYGDNNPMPYNNLSVKLSFTYRFICVLTKIFIMLVGFLNNIITIIGALPCKLAEVFRKIGGFFNFKIPPGFRPLRPVAKIFFSVAKVFDLLTPPCIAISNEFCSGSTTHAYTYYPGCGCKGLANVAVGLCNCVWKKTRDRHNETLAQMGIEDRTTAINNDAELYNCVESELAESNDATSFNFQNDWINGVLYAPLWYRKITPKRTFLFGLFKRKAKDEWCSADHVYNGLTRIFQPCAVDRKGTKAYTNHNGDSETAVYMNNDGGCSDGCHEKKTTVGLNKGLIRTKQTMLGQTVYYYKPIEFELKSKNYKHDKDSDGTLKLLFATDIVLLGSLNDCDLNGVPQFFKSLESSTYKLPPNMLFTDNVVEQKMNPDGTLSPYYEQSSTTEMTGNDWGNSNQDMCGAPDGGLFYNIGCSTIEMMPKSCINLSRICEFGVSLDETKWVPNLNDVKANGDNAFSELIPDGFISKDELYNDDERSMFATLNGNELITKLNTENGLKEYDFRHLYIDNFDNSLHDIMQNRQRGCRGKTYQYNYNLEDFNPDYYDFRMGKNPFYYDDVNGKKPTLPRYENSFYFYFGLKVGKTAIDKFNTQFFAECHNTDEAVSPIGVNVMPNSWCSDGIEESMDGFIKLDLSNISLPCDIIIKDNNSDSEIILPEVSDEKIILINGEIDEETKKEGYVKSKNGQGMIPNGYYTLTLTDNDGEIITADFELSYPYLRYNVETTNFKQPDNVLLERYTTRDAIASIREGVNDKDKYPFTREIGGTIAIYDITDGFGEELAEYEIEVSPINNIEGFSGWNDRIKKGDSKYWVEEQQAYIIGVPKGDEQYKITVMEVCQNGSENNRYTQIVMVNNPTPYKLYINDIIDYDVIKDWNTGFKINKSGNRVTVVKNGAISDKWFNMSDEKNYDWVKLNKIKKNIDAINDAIEMAHDIDGTFSLNKIMTNGSLMYDNLKQYIDYAAANRNINIESQCDIIVNACNEIENLKKDFMMAMKSTFWLTCPDSSNTVNLMAITDDTPVGYHIACRMEKLDNNNNVNVLQEYNDGEVSYSFNETNQIDDITIPSLSTNDSVRFGGGETVYDNVTLALDNNSGYNGDARIRYPFFIGVTNSSEVKDDAPYGETIPSSIKHDNIQNLFGFHILDKLLSVNFIAWAAMYRIPYYKPENGKEGKTVSMNGLFASKIFNGVTDNGKFETAIVGDEQMIIERDNRDSEDSMPTRRYLTEHIKESKGNFTHYRVNNSINKYEQYLPLLSKSVDLEIEDANGCSVNDTVYGNLTVTLNSTSVNNRINSKTSILQVRSTNGTDEGVTYFLYKVGRNHQYPLNYADLNNKINNSIEENTVYGNNMTYGIFSYAMNLEKLISNSTTDATTRLYKDDSENEEQLTPVQVNDYFKLNTTENYNDRTIGSTGLFIDDKNGLNGEYYIIARTSNECRAISPVYAFVDVKGEMRLMTTTSKFEDGVEQQPELDADGNQVLDENGQPVMKDIVKYSEIVEKKIGFGISNSEDLYYFNNFNYNIEISCIIDSQNTINGSGVVTVGNDKMVYRTLTETEYRLLKRYFNSISLIGTKPLVKKTTMTATDVTGLKHILNPSIPNEEYEQFLITFNLNGNGYWYKDDDDDKVDDDRTFYIEKNSSYLLENEPQSDNDGIVFNGWSEDKYATSGELPPQTKTATASTIWYAIWGEPIMVIFNPDVEKGGQWQNGSKDKLSVFVENNEASCNEILENTKDGVSFIKWICDDDTVNITTNENGNVIVETDHSCELYPQWEYTVRWIDNDNV